jgi:hypothetical protein
MLIGKREPLDRSLIKISFCLPLTSFASRLLAFEAKARKLEFGDWVGEEESPLATPPPEGSETRVAAPRENSAATYAASDRIITAAEVARRAVTEGRRMLSPK